MCDQLLIITVFIRLFLLYTVISFRKSTLKFKKCVCVCVCLCSVLSNSLWPHGLSPMWPLCLWTFSAKNTGVGCHFFLQGIFPVQDWTWMSLASPALAERFFTACTKCPYFVEHLEMIEVYENKCIKSFCHS